MATETRYLVVQGSSADQRHCWATFIGRVGFEPHGVEMRELSFRDLGEPDLTQPGQLFLAARNLAVDHGYEGGFPTYEVEGSGSSRRFSVALLRESIATRQMVPRQALAMIASHETDGFHGHPHNWARGHGFITGFPSYLSDTEGDEQSFELVLIRQGAGSHQMVLNSEIDGGLQFHDYYSRVRQIQALARAKGFLAAIPVGWCDQESTHFMQIVRNDWTLRDLQKREGWRVRDFQTDPPVVGGDGLIHYSATYTLEREVESQD